MDILFIVLNLVMLEQNDVFKDVVEKMSFALLKQRSQPLLAYPDHWETLAFPPSTRVLHALV